MLSLLAGIYASIGWKDEMKMDYEKMMTDLEEKINKSASLNKELRLARMDTYKLILGSIELGEIDKAVEMLTEMIEFYQKEIDNNP